MKGYNVNLLAKTGLYLRTTKVKIGQENKVLKILYFWQNV